MREDASEAAFTTNPELGKEKCLFSVVLVLEVDLVVVSGDFTTADTQVEEESVVVVVVEEEQQFLFSSASSRKLMEDASNIFDDEQNWDLVESCSSASSIITKEEREVKELEEILFFGVRSRITGDMVIFFSTWYCR